MRLIDAEELVKDFLNHCRTEFEIKNHCLTDENVLFLIQNAPTVSIDCKHCNEYEAGYTAGIHDAIRPQGEWILNPNCNFEVAEPFYYVCDKCNCPSRSNNHNFCPNCGSEMRCRK